MPKNDWRVGRSNRPARLSLCTAFALAMVVPQAATAQAPAYGGPRAQPHETVDSFYATHTDRPLWLGNYGETDEAALALIDRLRGARIDGLDPDRYRPIDLERAVRDARSGQYEDIHRADRMLSEAFLVYVRDTRRRPQVDMIWVDPELFPAAPDARALLDQVAAAPSAMAYLEQMPWMNPIYVGLRQALSTEHGLSPADRDRLRLNLERARALPPATGKYVIVNAAAATLSMVEDGRTVDTMRVVVGKPVHPTPMMAALIRFTSLNPYWNVPADLAAERVAPNVVKDGPAYLKAKGYELLSSWADDATVISPDTVDWTAVAAGRAQVRLRQLPGPANAMGKMKFMFPNAQGIYLHDTPDKGLLVEESRMFSGGCVRLEDAPRLAKWLYEGRVPTTSSSLPEQRVDLPRPVPVYLTYLTAVPGADGVAYLPDVYDRDRAALALLDGQSTMASR